MNAGSAGGGIWGIPRGFENRLEALYHVPEGNRDGCATALTGGAVHGGQDTSESLVAERGGRGAG